MLPFLLTFLLLRIVILRALLNLFRPRIVFMCHSRIYSEKEKKSKVSWLRYS